MVAIHNFHKLVLSARLFMKKASWGYCVLVFYSSGEPVTHPRSGDSCAPGGSGNEFEVERTTTCEEGADVALKAPMDHESSTG